MGKKLCCVFLLVGVFFVLGGENAYARSLWSEEGNTWEIFSDRKARRIGDILTVVVSERTTLTTSKSTTNEKSGNQSLGGGTGIFDIFKAATISGSDSFEATGNATDTNRVTANIAVTVVDVMQNGNMVVEGKQSIWQNKDEHKIILSGIVRPEDVSPSNTIPSTKIANASVKFDGKGPLNAKQRQGILTQIFNILF